MKLHTIISFSLLMFASCDCIQQAKGIVLDSKTLKPIANVSLGKDKKEDSTNPYSKRIYTNDSGQFDYHSVSGGFRQCPDLVLYFNKPRYKTITITLPSFTQNDTVYLDKIPFTEDSSFTISSDGFDRQIESCIKLLQAKQLKEISDDQHIEIMMCLNTIFRSRFQGGIYDEFEQVIAKKEYIKGVTKVYPDWSPNLGMGLYFPTLQMELGGTPGLYATYNVIK